jgi:hypothetical protein
VHPLPHGRGSVTEPRASASGHSHVIMTLCLAMRTFETGMADGSYNPHHSFAAIPRAFILRYRCERSSPSMSAARVTLPLASSSFLRM